MSNLVQPKLLRKVKSEVIDIHTNISTVDAEFSDEMLEFLVKMVTSWRKETIASRLKLLEEEQITILCKYVTNNYLEVDCTNIINVIKMAATGEDIYIVFQKWQNKYSNLIVKKLLCECVQENKGFESYLVDKGSSASYVSEWICQNDIVEQIGKVCSGTKSLEEYTMKLKKVGVVEESKLYSKCMDNFILFCGKEAYLKLGDKKLVENFRRLTVENTKKFLENFLRSLSVLQLYDFIELAKEAKGTMTKELKEEYDQFLERKGLLKKCKEWFKIISFIGVDEERIEYWKQYLLGATETHRCPGSGTMYMVFESIVITEFIEKGKGPAYFMSKDLFYKDVQWKMKANTDLSKVDSAREKVRSKLYDYYKLKMPGLYKRLPHPEGWQWKIFDPIMKEFNISKTKE